MSAWGPLGGYPLASPQAVGGGATVYTLDLLTGSYAVSGQSANLTVSRKLDLAAGSYTVTGQTIDLTYSSFSPTYSLDLLPGSYSVAGQSVNLSISRALSLGVGSYSISGRSVSLTYSGTPAVQQPLRTWYYIPGVIPYEAPAWLQRELQAVSQATYGAAPYLQMQPQSVAPDKPREGLMVYADGTNWDPGSGAGVYVRSSSAWVKL